jgi:hypothetical protein
MSQKPPPMFSRLESVKLFITPKALRWAGVLLVLLIAPSQADRLIRVAPVGPTPLPVPVQEWTTEAKGWASIPALLGTIPKPGPNQKRSGRCNPKAAQVEINGGCWVKTETPRPCPEGIQWEHDDGRCYLPVAEAKPVPQSGEPFRVNIAGE